MYILLLCSLISVTILLERILYYRKLSKAERTEFMIKIKRALKDRKPGKGHGDLQRRLCSFLQCGFFRP